MASENTETSGHDVRDQAAQHTLAANPLVGVRGRDVVASARTLLGRMASNPMVVAQQWLALIGELGRIATGASELAPDPKDKRFADPAWKESFPYRALAQAYLAWAGALNRCVDETKMDKRDAERARFVISLLVDAMSPTNSLAGNPSALKKLVETGGVSMLQGLENFVGDLARNGGLPAQVDTRKFAVGRNLATTPGSVVYRNAVMELIQYQPMTDAVHARPLLIAPPQINKFYVFDLAPEKSIIQLALKGGLQTFAISWKNPTSAESHFGLDIYVGALEDAADVMRDITNSQDINIWGSCSGGITTSAFLGNLAARGERKVHSATVAVCVLDMAVAQDTTAGMFVTPESIAAAKQASQLAGVVEGRELARMFAWMRPNDLIWSYWVNNYLLGNAPPAFDVLYWNNDTTRLPARLHGDFLDLINTNPYVNPGQLNVRGAPLDMGRVDIESYVVAGTTDHITPWQGCYNTAKLYGERSTFVLSNSGHIQSLLNPPGNPKATFWAGSAHEPSPEAWLERATKHTGSWWPHWLEWIKARSGETRPAPLALGSDESPPLDAAPGRYVMETKVQISLRDVAGQIVRVGVRPGDKGCPPLLVFNGIGASIELVEPFLAAFHGPEVVVFDVPGVGGSPAPRLPYRPSTLSLLSARLLDQLGHGEVDVLGVSWGGAPAQQFAFQQGKRCRRLVLAATSPGHLMVPGKLTTMLRMATPRRYKDPDYMTRVAGDIYGGAFRASPELARAHLRHVHWSSDYGYYLQLIACLGWSSLPWLRLLAQPTLVMAGSDDPIVPVINGRILARLIPHARLVTIDDGHLFLLTSARESAGIISEFLN